MRGILIDLDGVLYQGDQPVVGAAETVQWLRQQKIPHLFVTNTTSRPRKAVRQKLQKLGINVKEERILTPLVVARQWLRAHVQGYSLFLVPQASVEDLAAIPELPEGQESGAAAIVIGDLGEQWDFPILNRAFRLLMDNPNLALIALGMTRYWRGPDGLRLDVAPFVKALEHASGVEAIVLGKPSAAFFHEAIAIGDMSQGETFMIGDDIRGDVEGAQRAGIKGILVKTGKYRPSDLDGPVVPDAVLDSIADLPRWWEEHCASNAV